MTNTALKRTICSVAAVALVLTALLFAAGPRSSCASSTAKSLAVLFTNDTLGYLEACG